MEILTVTELAALLKMSKAQMYELTKEPTRSSAMRNNPIPFLKITWNVRRDERSQYHDRPVSGNHYLGSPDCKLLTRRFGRAWPYLYSCGWSDRNDDALGLEDGVEPLCWRSELDDSIGR